MKKISIIVDDPKRDLLGCLHVACEFLKKKELDYEVYITPYNLTEKEILSIQPDIVILNYLRKANYKIVKILDKLNIVTFILDTEGGAFQNDEEFYNSIYLDKSLKNKIFYLCWGKLYAKNINSRFSNITAYPTGQPRFDVYNIKNLKQIFKENNKKFILYTSRISVANPKYSSVKQELLTFKKNRNISIKKSYQFYSVQKKELKNQIKLVKKLAKDFPEEKIIFRPHPFESKKIYIKEFSKYSNIMINNTNHISYWLAKSTCCIQRGCTTGLESFVAKVPSLSPNWRGFSYKTNLDLMNINIFCNSYDDLKENIKLCLKNKKNIHFQKNKLIKSLIKNYFFSFDGKSASRVVKIVNNVSLFKKNVNFFLFYKVRQFIKKTFLLDKIIDQAYFLTLRNWDISDKKIITGDISFYFDYLKKIHDLNFINIKNMKDENIFLRSWKINVS
jgi:surface carbohydrate biosynthesis protein